MLSVNTATLLTSGEKPLKESVQWEQFCVGGTHRVLCPRGSHQCGGQGGTMGDTNGCGTGEMRGTLASSVAFIHIK